MYYSPWVTILKGVVDFLKVLLSGSAAIVFIDVLSDTADRLPATWEGFLESWPLLLIALLVGILRAFNNYRKNRYLLRSAKTSKWVRRIFPVILVGILLSGCISTKTREIVIESDGSSYTFEYVANSSAWPFGKVDSAVHEMSYFAEGGSSLVVGQNARGVDNTAQVEAIRVIGEILGTTIANMAFQGMFSNPALPADGSTLKGIIDKMAVLEEIIRRLGEVRGDKH